MRKNTIIYIALGAVAVGAFLYVRNQRDAQAQASRLQSEKDSWYNRFVNFVYN